MSEIIMGNRSALFSWRRISSFILCVVCAAVCATVEELEPPCDRIDAAVHWSSDSTTYLFSGQHYMKYNDHHRAEQDVFPVAQLARGLPSNIDAATNSFRRRRSLYFKGCSVYTLNERKRKLRRRPVRRFRLPCDVDAAVNTGGEILVFKGCLFYRLARNSRRAVIGGNTTDLNLPCDVDAAVRWHNGTVYVIKDDVIFTLTSEGRAEGSTHIDALSICSWNLCSGHVATSTWEAQLPEEEFPCNGDTRFCSLRVDQTTLAGSHNAGAGFDGGFLFLECWVRNQYLSALEQLRYGIRYLDVDPSWEHCGLLGTFHNFVCGGPICRMIKQIKHFLRESRHEVVVITFNHEMTDHDKVLPALLRQLTSQLGQYLNSYRRTAGVWPTLGHAVRTNKRLFVLVDRSVEGLEVYAQHRWIHSQRMLSSTWRADTAVEGDCTQIPSVASEQCELKADAPLLELSIFGTSTSCVTTIADLCLPLVHQVSRDCGKFRHAQGKAPNVLLVDFPERAPSEAQSVVTAAYFQNVRNVARLRTSACHVQLDAAVTWTQNGTQNVLVFSGHRVVILDWTTKIQQAERNTDSVAGFTQVDAAFLSSDGRQICSTHNCEILCRDRINPAAIVDDEGHSSLPSLGLPCHVDAAVTMDSGTYFFKGCQYWLRYEDGHMAGPSPITDFGLPCDVTAVLQSPDGDTYFFKDEYFWRYEDGGGLSPASDVLDWSADFVHCD